MNATALLTRLALSAAASALLLPAQPGSSELQHVIFTKVQPGMAADFREMQAEINEAYKKEGTPWRAVWTTAIFGEPGYVVAFPVGKMERYDTPNPVRKSMNDADYARYTQKMARIVASTHHVLVRTRPDLGISSGRTTANRAVVTTVVVEPGKTAAFEAFVKNHLIPAWQKGGMKDVWVDQTLMGSAANEYTFLYLFDKWAEMEGGSPMEKALGREGWDKVRSNIAGLAKSVKTDVAAYVPELSYQPAK
jgi:hypothetical protein